MPCHNRVQRVALQECAHLACRWAVVPLLAQMDADGDGRGAAQSADVRNFPTLILYSEGVQIDTYAGARTKAGGLPLQLPLQLPPQTAGRLHTLSKFSSTGVCSNKTLRCSYR